MRRLLLVLLCFVSLLALAPNAVADEGDELESVPACAVEGAESAEDAALPCAMPDAEMVVEEVTGEEAGEAPAATPTAAPVLAQAPPPFVVPTLAPSTDPLPAGQPGISAVPPSSLSPDPCSRPPSSAQLADDTRAMQRAAAAGITMRATHQCDGYTVFLQEGLAPQMAEDFSSGVRRIFTRLAQESSIVPSQRIGTFLLANVDSRRRTHQAVTGGTAGLDPAPGYAAGSNVWINAGHPAFSFSEGRIAASAHELTHVFVGLAAGRQAGAVPAWFNEGFAVQQEMAMFTGDLPTYVDRMAGHYRDSVLTALTGRGGATFFTPADITTHAQWVNNYTDNQRRERQYAQSYYMMDWLVAHKGAPNVWRLLRALSQGRPFTPTFSEVFGMSPVDLDATVRESLKPQLSKAARTVRLTVTIAPSAVHADTWLQLKTQVNGFVRAVSATAVTANTYTLEINADGQISETSGRLRLRDLPRETWTQDGFLIAIGNTTYRGRTGGAENGFEVVSYSLSYGDWIADYPEIRAFYPSASSAPEPVGGLGTDPFPSGNSIRVSIQR